MQAGGVRELTAFAGRYQHLTRVRVPERRLDALVPERIVIEYRGILVAALPRDDDVSVEEEHRVDRLDAVERYGGGTRIVGVDHPGAIRRSHERGRLHVILQSRRTLHMCLRVIGAHEHGIALEKLV